jgi:hypothetical protein
VCSADPCRQGAGRLIPLSGAGEFATISSFIVNEI